MVTFIISVLVGVVVGILSGLLGIGGGTVMVPLFRLGFGMSALSATATSLFTIIPTSLVGFVTHIRNKTCIPKVGVIAGLGGACTSPVGVYLASISPSWLVMLAAGIIVGFSAYKMFRKAASLPKTAASGQPVVKKEERGEPLLDEEPFTLSPKRIAQTAGIGLAAGLASGYVGVGGGFLMVPLFIGVLGIMMRQASGTSLVAVMILAIPGVIEQGLLGNINYLEGIAMAIGSIPGAIVGASLIRRVPERQLRLLFGMFLLIAAVLLVVNEVAPLL